MFSNLFSEAMGKVIRLHLESCQAYVCRDEIEVSKGTLDNSIIEGPWFQFSAGLRLRFNQDVREGNVVHVRINPTSGEVCLWIAIDHEGLVPSKRAASRQLPRDRRLPNAAFLIRYRDYFHSVLTPPFSTTANPMRSIHVNTALKHAESPE